MTDQTDELGAVGIAYMTLDQEILTAAIDNARESTVAADLHAFGKEMYQRRIRSKAKMLNGKPVARSMATKVM